MTAPDFTPLNPPERPVPHDARARRRRARRTLFPADAEGQAAVLADLARRSYPTFELFIYAILSGAIIAAGYLLDSQAVLIFGILAAPLLTSWVGLSIAAVTGSPRYFFQTFAALLISALIVFLIGVGAGFAALPFEPRTHQEVHLHASLWIPELAVLTLGAILLVITFVRTEDRPYLPSVVLAYSFYLPVSAAGFGLGANLDGVWSDAALVALVHFSWATLFAILTLVFMRFRPRSFGGFIFSLLIIIAILAALITWMGFGGAARNLVNGTTLPSKPEATKTTLPTVTVSWSPSPKPNPSPSATLLPSPSATASSTATESATENPAETSAPSITIVPTPVFAKINSPEGGGARVRSSPGGDYLFTLNNGYIVTVLGETVDVGGVIWVKILVDRNGEKTEGWIIQSLLATATPIVNWEPTETPTPTQ
ncbi:MAG: SH3 domain-containing protein [Anaerolineaceae bacterium]|nr:MAG: SH3 domain-containing protein [Anaerolineaceae bacterium]